MIGLHDAAVRLLDLVLRRALAHSQNQRRLAPRHHGLEPTLVELPQPSRGRVRLVRLPSLDPALPRIRHRRARPRPRPQGVCSAICLPKWQGFCSTEGQSDFYYVCLVSESW